MISASVNLRRLLHPSVAAILITAAACNDPTPQPTPAPPGSSGETITGRERLGWTQTAGSPDELATYRYSLYADGQRRILEDVGCTPAAGGTTAECTAPLPALGAGRHSLEIAAFFLWGDDTIEGAKSAAIQVTIAGVVTPAGPGGVQGGAFTSSAGLPLTAEILARDLTDPVDIAAAPDGRVFVAERGGRIRVVEPGAVMATMAVDDNVLALVGEPSSGDVAGVRGLTLSADFARSRQMYIAYTTSDRQAAVVRIARVREIGGRYGEAAAIATFAVQDADVSVVLRTGPDGNLYVGIGGEEAPAPRNVASGQILRLRSDGTTPSDNPRSTPLFSSGHQDLRGLAWLPEDASGWQVQRHGGRAIVRRVEPGADSTAPLGNERGVLVLPAGSDPSGLAAMQYPDSALHGDLLVATAGTEDLLRLRVTADGTPRVRERLLDRRFGRIAQVATAPDGSIYFVTGNQDEWGPGHELLVRLTTGRRASDR